MHVAERTGRASNLPYMKTLSLALVVAALAKGQTPPSIGVIDTYGLRKVAVARLRQALNAKEGDPLPASKGDAEERIDAIAGIVESHLEAVCCDQGKVVLYIGVEEKGSPHFELREEPDGEAKLPDEVATAYLEYRESFEAAARRGLTAEDLTQGHALSADAATRALQERLPKLVDTNLAIVRDVLRNASDEDQRAVAATLIGYAPDKKSVMDDLQYALRDPDPGVRDSAAQALRAFGVLGRLDPTKGPKVEATWFVEMLNSLSFTDRSRAVAALQVLTEGGDEKVLDRIHERALASLIDMARWKTLEHALPAYMLLGRVGGLPEADVTAAWKRGDREFVVKAAEKRKK